VQELGWHHAIDLEDGIRQVYQSADKTCWT